MRSNDQRLALLALAALLSACSLLPSKVPEPAAAAASAPAAAPALATATATESAKNASAPEAPAAASGPAASPPPVVVSATTQQSYEAALQALRAGRHAEAERALRPLSQALPALAGVHANLGLALRGQGKQADSLAALQQAAKLSPGNAQIHNELGIAYRLNGRFAQARQSYEQALALQPQYPAAMLNLAILLDLYLGDSAAALARYERYQALVPGGDAAVGKWMVDLKNRKPATASSVPAPQRVSAASPQEK